MIDIATCFTYEYVNGTHPDELHQNINTDERSTRVIDLWSVASLPSGNTYITLTGHNAPWLIAKSIAAGSGGTGMQMNLVSSTTTTLSGATVVAVYKFTLDQMTAGALLVNSQIPAGRYNRYLGLYFDIDTTTCAQFLAYLADGPEPAAAVRAEQAT